ncbi:hypothetical protein SS37A_25950 [Methylocystis iwaonis]|uniref:Cell envelope biogenesis protein TolA n=1 Tax=Methylocystis iwaonis TaxID=2885079 RepID=A0ABM8EAP8_9HYPH|nr:hypothetical protein SS37A_25950 [Methylocystis iwaonis]
MRPIQIFFVLLAATQYVGALAAEEAQPKREPSGADETLSQRLDRQKGVLKPKQDVDPSFVKPAPKMDPRSTPEIKPPSPEAK